MNDAIELVLMGEKRVICVCEKREAKKKIESLWFVCKFHLNLLKV